jgi:HlyD family secretion protein
MIELFQQGHAMWLRVIVALAASACCDGSFGVVAAQPNNAGASADRAVTVVAAKRTCFVDTLQVTGVLVPREDILVQPDREGLQISQILVEPGETVVSGQVLARLSPPEGQPGGSIPVQAPAGGVISFMSAAIGMTTSARGIPLFRIASRGEMELIAETPAKSLLRLASGQAAKTEIIGVGEFSGNIREVSTAINPTTQLGQVRVTVSSDPRLRVGAFGRAIIDLGRRCGPTVPLSAVLYETAGAVVQVVRDGRVETRAVTVGLVVAGQAEIREGVSEGDQVIARSGAFFRDGDRVRSISTEPASK